jgi:hypothetical protein
MRFGTWNVRSLYRADLLKTVASDLAKYNLDAVTVQRSDKMRAVVIQQTIIHFSVEMGLLVITWGQTFSYIRESYQQERG